MTTREAFLAGCVDKHKKEIFNAERFIWQNPETGYREWKTSKYLAEKFNALGYQLTFAGDIPGFYTDIDTGKPGPKVLVMGELDALLCENHPEAVNGVAHACGHNAQCAGLLGLAAALRETGALDGLCGSIRLMTVPAEELIEVPFREELRKRGIIRFYSGKAEFMRRGYMNNVDMAVLIHTHNLGEKYDFFSRRGSNGFITKEIIYRGKASHAASSPECGINALAAATLGVQAVNALRETFKEDQKIRVHGIISNGGTACNVIPDNVHIEMAVRGATREIIQATAKKIDRALIGAAVSIGTEIDIKNSPGYTPLKNDEMLLDVFKQSALALCGEERINIDKNNWSTGSTDMGDLCEIMPTIQPYAAGAVGTGHGSDYGIDDPDRACCNSAKAELLLIDKLLENDASIAKNIIAHFTPSFTINEYVIYLESCFNTSKPISYMQSKIVIDQ